MHSVHEPLKPSPRNTQKTSFWHKSSVSLLLKSELYDNFDLIVCENTNIFWLKFSSIYRELNMEIQRSKYINHSGTQTESKAIESHTEYNWAKLGFFKARFHHSTDHYWARIVSYAEVSSFVGPPPVRRSECHHCDQGHSCVFIKLTAPGVSSTAFTV